MNAANPTIYVPWRDRAFVSTAEAAAIVARSPTWIRERIVEGRLEAVQLRDAGRIAVTVESLRRLISEAVPAGPEQLALLRQRRGKPDGRTLRLVISNSP